MTSTRSLLFAFAATASVFSIGTAFANDKDTCCGKADAACCKKAGAACCSEKQDDAWLKAAKAAYPLETCVVSGDKLEGSDMGAPVDYVYKEEGKPDRLVRFCCKGCVKDFKKDPAKYLKKIDEAVAAKAKSAAPASHS